jgi:hypothetical protein
LVKCLDKQSEPFLAQVKEEIFEIDPVSKRVFNYAVVMERPNFTLLDFLLGDNSRQTSNL